MRSARQSNARTASRVAKARATIESRKWEPTAIGWRPESTVIAPSGIWATVATASRAAQRRIAAGAPGMRRATIQVTHATAPTTPDSSRLVYSIQA